jgi:hypothetical protein
MPRVHRLAPSSPDCRPRRGGREEGPIPRRIEPLSAILAPPGGLIPQDRPYPGGSLAGGTGSPSLISGSTS